MGKQVYWMIPSPIDLEIFPVREVQVECQEEELEEIGYLTDIDFWVKRGPVFVGVKPSGWFRMHQALFEGQWHNMLIPNGERSFEWKLGWSVATLDDYLILIQPIENEDRFVVFPGLINSRLLPQFTYGLGMPIAFEPQKSAIIRRGEVLAKMLIVPTSILNIKSTVTDKWDNGGQPA